MRSKYWKVYSRQYVAFSASTKNIFNKPMLSVLYQTINNLTLRMMSAPVTHIYTVRRSLQVCMNTANVNING